MQLWRPARDVNRLLWTAIGLVLLSAVMSTAPAAAQGNVMCGGEVATIVGTSGNDTLIGTAGDDVISALQGDDIVKGAGGDDIICGGFGNDELFGGDGFDVLYGAQGDDLLVSAKTKAGPDTAGSRMFGGAGNDDIRGSTGWDRMQGGAGSDQLYGRAGRDWLRGGPGNDRVDGGAWIDDMNGGLGRDQVVVLDGDNARGGAGVRDVCLLVSNLGDATMRGCARQGSTALGEMRMVQALDAPAHVQTAVLQRAFIEVGYDITGIDQFEGIDLVLGAVATGQYGFWASSQYPRDLEWWNVQHPDGSLAGDHLTRLDNPVSRNADGDIEITANTMFLEGDPVARRLLNNIELDVAAAEQEYLSGDLSQESLGRIADEWIASNRATVDGWLAVAIGVR